MTPSELRRIGFGLYGPRWKPALAKAVGRAKRTVYYWATGEHPIPQAAAELIRELTSQHQPHGDAHD